MILSSFVLILWTAEASGPETAPTVVIEKQIIYQKETVVDLSGSTVEGEKQAPPAFFLSKTQGADVRGLLSERLKFSFRDYNLLGF